MSTILTLQQGMDIGRRYINWESRKIAVCQLLVPRASPPPRCTPCCVCRREAGRWRGDVVGGTFAELLSKAQLSRNMKGLESEHRDWLQWRDFPCLLLYVSNWGCIVLPLPSTQQFIFKHETMLFQTRTNLFKFFKKNLSSSISHTVNKYLWISDNIPVTAPHWRHNCEQIWHVSFLLPFLLRQRHCEGLRAPTQGSHFEALHKHSTWP